MGKRETLYQQFGPKLVEAMLETFLAELNAVRVKAGMPEKTKDDLETAVDTHLSATTDYDWMNIRQR